MAHQRHIVGAKLAEVLGRGFFVVYCTYTLPLKEAGQFGLVATLLNLAAFALSYERQIAVMREVAGAPAAHIHQRLLESLRFQTAHAAWALPLIAVIAALWFRWPATSLALLLPILLAEHLSNQVYHVVLIESRRFALLCWAALRSLALSVAVLIGATGFADEFNITWVLLAWASISVVFLAAVTWTWRRYTPEAEMKATTDGLPPKSVLVIYRESALHFLSGSVAVAAVQFDRVVVGLSLQSEAIGLYFRHVTLAALVLQFFSVVFFGRVAPRVYALARDGQFTRSHEIVWVEYRRFALVVIGGAALAFGLDHAFGLPSNRFGLVHGYLALLGLAVLMRAAAEFAGLLLLTRAEDAALLRNQAIALCLGCVLLLALSKSIGLFGALCGALVAPLAYLLLNSLSLRRLNPAP
jgi:hypothetical protein